MKRNKLKDISKESAKDLRYSWRRPLSYRNQSIDLRSKSGFYMITASVMKELTRQWNDFLKTTPEAVARRGFAKSCSKRFRKMTIYKETPAAVSFLIKFQGLGPKIYAYPSFLGTHFYRKKQPPEVFCKKAEVLKNFAIFMAKKEIINIAKFWRTSANACFRV